MSNAVTDTDVLIVGAGPVGLFLANECARRGLRWRLVETRSSQSAHSKALAIFPRTLEILDMAGLVDPFLEKANRVTVSRCSDTWTDACSHAVRARGEPVSIHRHGSPGRDREAAGGRHSGEQSNETTFVSAAEQDGYVSVTMDRKGEAIKLTASFIVGCDGAHSVVRRLLNLPFEGAEYADSFMLADAETNQALPADEMQLCPSELGPVAIFPMSATRRRIVATVKNTEGDAPSLDLVRKVLAERAPIEIEAHALHWSSYFHIHHRQVAQLRVGRFFIAGDAAHIHSPFGGQGMNTGLHDVWNLVWKLDLVLRGRGSEELLESYSAERRPVIKDVIETTDLLTKAMGTPSKLAQILRDTVIPMVSRLAPFQHAFVQRLSELGIAYRGSPIVEGAGERYFDDSLRGGDGIRSRFLLVFDNDADSSTREAAERLSESFRDIVELRLRARDDITLVRPDGYIAFSARRRDGVAALRAVRSLLEHQTSLSLQ